MIIIANVIEGLLYARYCANSFAGLVSFNLHNTLREEQLYFHITNEEPEAK